MDSNEESSLQSVRHLIDLSVSNEFELNEAIDNFVTIAFLSDIYLNSSISIYGINQLNMNGNGFKLDAQSYDRCLLIVNSTISINNLIIANGYSVSIL